MTRYMLDTNTVSHLLRDHPLVVRRVTSVPMASLVISSITAGELHFGLAKRPKAKRLHAAVGEFLLRVAVLPWDSAVAKRYGTLRARMERRGKTLGALDLQIAAHSLETEAVLITNDQTFGQVPDLRIEDWTRK